MDTMQDFWYLIVAFVVTIGALAGFAMPFAVLRIERLLIKQAKAREDEEMRTAMHQQRLEGHLQALGRHLQQLNDTLGGARIDQVEQ